MSSTTLTIQGMSCGHCVNAVTKALKGVDGITAQDVKIGSATVEFDDSKVTASQIAQVVTEEGYLAVAGA